MVPYSNSTVVAEPFAFIVAETVAVSEIPTFEAASVVALGEEASSDVKTYETRKVTELFAGMESYLKARAIPASMLLSVLVFWDQIPVPP